MSVAGDIIDDLKIGRKTQYCALSLMCGALLASAIAIIVLPSTFTGETTVSAKSSSAALAQPEKLYAGNLPTPR